MESIVNVSSQNSPPKCWKGVKNDINIKGIFPHKTLLPNPHKEKSENQYKGHSCKNDIFNFLFPVQGHEFGGVWECLSGKVLISLSPSPGSQRLPK